mgnify:CR=1 FL=1
MPKENDQFYINLVLEGDVNAFSELISRYKDMVFSMVLNIAKNREEAEEIAQDTFIRAYKYLNKFIGYLIIRRLRK